MNHRWGFRRYLVVCGLGLSVGAASWAESVGGAYTCVDAQGRKLTSDRPIPECVDREQKVLNPSGTLKQVVGPVLTAQERAKREAMARQDQEEQHRAQEERRRDRVLLTRYPNRAAHDTERSEALGQIAVVSQAASGRLAELAKQRKKLDDELEFYKKDPKKAPAYLQRQSEDNSQSTAVQKRFLVDQEEEVRRVNRRFDEELERLRPLWAAAAAAAATGGHP